MGHIKADGSEFWPGTGGQRLLAAEECKPGSSKGAGVGSKGTQGEALCTVNAES